MGQEKLTVGLIYGGKSGEHEVSLQTAFAVSKAFDYAKYELLPFYITKRGEWRVGGKLDAPFAALEELKLERAAGGTAEAINLLFSGLAEGKPAIDVAFPLLHGTNGEDGTIQGLFEMANLPYVGAGVLASAAGMDKVIMKKLFAEAGLEQCKYCYFTAAEWERSSHVLLQGMEEKLGYPCFVKPANLGSSVGISKARTREELLGAVANAFRYDVKVIVEEFVDAREVEVGVLGNDEPIASVPGEIVSSGEYYDYQAKYLDGKSQMLIPAPLDTEIAERVRDLAVKAFKAIAGNGLCRADFFLTKSGNRLLVNEVNTMPGFTPFSMYPLLWRETGVSYEALLDRLIGLALERYEMRQNLDFENGVV
ncbi:D-alanine--D-alanine ligase [Paenibacillus sp. alder61]|uniref:D-alanine--D-alanine ligase n=1 Tax=Paenibacillus faecis TaxID=862114 RepID=A0A5D0CPL8_9BACL|nr:MULTISPECIES: D-alanine--D-alanine ligase [Paenibacillus]MCA1296485.1 D-alanine--D-alanine ligase [Paenibacillus sp. alder61]TYA11698.1 D-alanine--D-alanine ligase [Paenibacillus faecis]